MKLRTRLIISISLIILSVLGLVLSVFFVKTPTDETKTVVFKVYKDLVSEMGDKSLNVIVIKWTDDDDVLTVVSQSRLVGRRDSETYNYIDLEILFDESVDISELKRLNALDRLFFIIAKSEWETLAIKYVKENLKEVKEERIIDLEDINKEDIFTQDVLYHDQYFVLVYTNDIDEDVLREAIVYLNKVKNSEYSYDGLIPLFTYKMNGEINEETSNLNIDNPNDIKLRANQMLFRIKYNKIFREYTTVDSILKELK